VCFPLSWDDLESVRPGNVTVTSASLPARRGRTDASQTLINFAWRLARVDRGAPSDLCNPLARRNSRQNSQLDVSYSRRRLPRPATAPPVAGDRAPDTPVGAGTIHDHIGPGHLTLIIFDPVGARSDSNLQSHTNMPDTDPDTDPVIVRVDDSSDPDGTARTAYGMRRGGFVLVRPDGHIADRGPSPEAARDALTRFAADPRS
jgi:hypothetical protein